MRLIILLALILGVTAQQSPPNDPPVLPTHEASGPPATPGPDEGDPPLKPPHTFVYLVPVLSGAPTSDR